MVSQKASKSPLLTNNEVCHHHFSSIDSTNSWAKRNLGLLNHYTINLVTADEQTSGRGRQKRVWESPPNKNLYSSFCFFVSDRTGISNIGQVMAVSIAQTLELLGFTPTLKWPNDIILDGKKVGGILCETTTDQDLCCVIVGVGLNINMTAEELAKVGKPATSLLEVKGEIISIEEVKTLLLEKFQENLKEFLKNGFTPFYDIYRELNGFFKGKQINFQANNHYWLCTFETIMDDGSLQIKLPTGETKVFFAGEILET